MIVASEIKGLRHKTAMKRSNLSRPVTAAIRDRVLKPEMSVFDFGCGHGTDVQLLKANGYRSSGWDPFYYPNLPKQEADVVNLGFVLNVIESPAERDSALREAFELAKECLIVAVRIDQAFFQEQYGDGALTRDGAFQKIYTQAEFRSYVEGVLERRIYINEPGIGYVFKSENAEQEFASNRYLNRLASHNESIIKKIHETVDTGKVARLIEELGRIPESTELTDLTFLGKRKFKDYIESSIMPLVDKARFQSSRNRIQEDILQAIAMTRIENRKFVLLRQYSPEFQITIKEMFGDYKEACRLSEEMLFRLGKEGEVAKAARNSPVGKLLPEDLYVHSSALEYIPGLLKLMLSLGESIVGNLNADVLKFSLHGKSMSFLFYSDFVSDPHPALKGSVRVDFRSGRSQVRDYSQSENPPILHRKETFVLPTYEHYEEFRSLTQQEEDAGLLSSSGIGFKNQWSGVLRERGYIIEGHQLRKLES